MKKLTLILIAAFAFCFIVPNTHAQSVKGVLVGLNLANVSGDDADELFDIDPSNLMGLAGGLFMVKPLNDNMGFRPEIQYSQNGSKFKEDDDSANFKAGYITLPLLLQYAVSTEGSMQPVLLVGPYVAFNLSSKITFDVEGEDIDDIDLKDDTKSMDYGLVIGGGLVINSQFELTARYIMGLTSIIDEEDVDVKNKTIQITAGIRL